MCRIYPCRTKQAVEKYRSEEFRLLCGILLKINIVHLTILRQPDISIRIFKQAGRGGSGKLLILRFTPRGLRRHRLETTCSCRISARTDSCNAFFARGGNSAVHDGAAPIPPPVLAPGPHGTRTPFLHRDSRLLPYPSRLESYCQTLCRLSHTFLRYSPFRLSTLDPRLPQEGGEIQIRLASTFESTRIVGKLMSHDLMLPAHSPRASPNLLNWWVVLSLRCNVSPPHRWLSGMPNPAPKPGAKAAAGEAPKPI